MKFVTVRYQEQEAPGVLTKDDHGVFLFRQILGDKAPVSVLDLIRKEDAELIETIKDYLDNPAQDPYLLDQVQLLAPITKPFRNIICLGLNYQDHADELEKSFAKDNPTPKAPIYFGKMATEIIGPGAIIDLQGQVTNAIDYEVEVVAVIGKKGKNIPAEEAYQHIFGYTIMNDLSARDLQAAHTQWLRGKSLDTFTAMGPSIVHRELIEHPLELDLSCRVNNETRQNSNTRNFIFDLPYVISDFSKGFTLEPGDMIATGTPSGVGMAYDPPKYLHKGDEVICKVQGLGELRNRLGE
ncbi:MAG: FAA hydrolase family protein [Tindallia sp. MSAO_Bac2]|nr:MAG: FAA hydrolase family protein [Tindallia sp. MSAO_Bac2]